MTIRDLPLVRPHPMRDARQPSAAEQPVDRAELSHAPTPEPVGVADALPPGDDTVLTRLRPFVRDVHVVGRAANGMPILGGRPIDVLVPEEMSPMPGQRWVVTPAIESKHRTLVDRPSDAIRADDRGELTGFIGPIVAESYGTRSGMAVLELGPATSTVLPELLGTHNQYIGADLSMPFLETQAVLLSEPGHRVPRAVQLQADTYELPVETGRINLVFTSCHPPFVSASPADKIRALSQVHRVLAPEGEFVLFPWHESEQPPAVCAALHARFDVISRHSNRPGRELLILRRKP